MKAVVIFVFAFAVLQIEANLLDLIRNDREAENCVTELNLNNERTFKIARRDHKPEDDAEFIKYMKCYWKKKGYLDQDGDINYDAVRQLFFDAFQDGFSSQFISNLADTVLSKCENIPATTVGQRAIKVGNCIVKNVRELTG